MYKLYKKEWPLGKSYFYIGDYDKLITTSATSFNATQNKAITTYAIDMINDSGESSFYIGHSTTFIQEKDKIYFNSASAEYMAEIIDDKYLYDINDLLSYTK